MERQRQVSSRRRFLKLFGALFFGSSLANACGSKSKENDQLRSSGNQEHVSTFNIEEVRLNLLSSLEVVLAKDKVEFANLYVRGPISIKGQGEVRDLRIGLEDLYTDINRENLANFVFSSKHYKLLQNAFRVLAKFFCVFDFSDQERERFGLAAIGVHEYLRAQSLNEYVKSEAKEAAVKGYFDTLKYIKINSDGIVSLSCDTQK